MRREGKRFLWRSCNAVLGTLLLVGLAGCGKDYSRDEFTRLTLHKTEAEVKRAVGEPQLVRDGKPKTWTYYRKTYDAANQKDDYRATLKFAPDPSNGQERVKNVEFGATS